MLGRSNRTQCCQRLATAATFLRKELCCPGAMTQRWAPPTRYTLRRIRASIMKDLIWFDNVIFSDYDKSSGIQIRKFSNIIPYQIWKLFDYGVTKRTFKKRARYFRCFETWELLNWWMKSAPSPSFYGPKMLLTRRKKEQCVSVRCLNICCD